MTHRAELSAVTKAMANNWADYIATALQLSQGERKKEQSLQLTFIFSQFSFLTSTQVEQQQCVTQTHKTISQLF